MDIKQELASIILNGITDTIEKVYQTQKSVNDGLKHDIITLSTDIELLHQKIELLQRPTIIELKSTDRLN